MVRSERGETFILGGLTSVFILLTIGLTINWLTGHEAQRSSHSYDSRRAFSSAPPLYGFGIPKGPRCNGSGVALTNEGDQRRFGKLKQAEPSDKWGLVVFSAHHSL